MSDKFDPFHLSPYPDTWAKAEFLLKLQQKYNSYLSRRKGFEDEDEFQLRCKNSVFPVGYSEELAILVGKIFDKANQNLVYHHDYLEYINKFLTKIDMPKMLRDFCHYGCYGILITYNGIEFEPTPISPISILGGIEINQILMQLRISSIRSEIIKKMLVNKDLCQMYELEDGRVLFTEYEHDNTDDYKIVTQTELYDSMGNGLTYIPFHYKTCTNFDSFMRSEPVFSQYIQYDLARYDTSSKVNEYVKAVLSPVLIRKSASAKFQSVTLDAGGIVNLLPNEELSWLEHDGKSIGTGFQQLDRMKQEQAKLGFSSLLEPTKLVQITAKEAEMTKIEQVPGLSLLAKEFEKLLNESFHTYLSLSNIEQLDLINNKYFTLNINLLDDTKVPPNEYKAEHIQKDYNSGVISKETYLYQMKKVGIYTEDFDVEKELQLTEEFDRLEDNSDINNNIINNNNTNDTIDNKDETDKPL